MKINTERQIVLDTETTGMNKNGPHYYGHRIIEIGAIEMINRRLTGRCFHTYLKPDRLVEIEAFKIHGISDEFLFFQPTFEEIMEKFINFIKGSELIIHNSVFDIGFINNEIQLCNKNLNNINYYCSVIDTLKLARNIFPGKRNNLDALSDRYGIDTTKRILHGALLDAEILSNVYLLMTGGQIPINFSKKKNNNFINKKIKNNFNNFKKNKKYNKIIKPIVIYANEEEIHEHKKFMKSINFINKNN
ncbi:dnaQ [Wigglesworthia glossinidia endosymbiont of Glossina brevipalpis]|uniref:DNA polymerase III subunit epsilon n=1 Tax=Wigglesworthia glossinidia brevipalpis TaxID=36870 RepID=Q8D3D2_WIGBR|nr:dnaQ [Wigglesworthia glossinidia endosymbiont of Glossina brevipalpis]